MRPSLEKRTVFWVRERQMMVLVALSLPGFVGDVGDIELVVGDSGDEGGREAREDVGSQPEPMENFFSARLMMCRRILEALGERVVAWRRVIPYGFWSRGSVFGIAVIGALVGDSVV